MKRFFLLTVFFGYLLANAQSFEGTITYLISYPGITNKAQLRDFPKEMILTIKGNNVRSDVKYPVHGTDDKVPPIEISQSKIVDVSTKSYYELLSVGTENKYIIESPSKFIEDKLKNKPAPKIAYQDSTKMISGYLCKIAVLTIRYLDFVKGDSADMPLTIYYTEALGNKNIYIDEDLREINGLLLDYTIYANNIKIRFSATKIKKKKIKDIVFDRPIEGYQSDIEKNAVYIQYLLNGGKLKN